MSESHGFNFDRFSLENPWAKSLAYPRSFEQELTIVKEAVLDWQGFSNGLNPDFSSIEACIAIKNLDGVIMYSNDAFRFFFTGGRTAVGHNAEAFAYWKTAQISKSTDEMIVQGSQFIDCEHAGKDAEGRFYTFRTYKYALVKSSSPEFLIVGMSRPIAFLGASETEKTKSLSELHALFLGLDNINQTICRLDARGDATKLVAECVGLTTRSIEIRRKKIQEWFQVERSMDVIRITIRLEEHGLLPPFDAI